MRKIYIHLETGYCGMDAHKCMEVDDSMSDEQIDLMVEEMAYENAISYGVEECPEEYCEDSDCEFEHMGSDNISGFWEDYDPERHDMYCF